MKITAAAIQMTSTQDRDRNLETAIALAGRAADRGASLIALPENWLYMRGTGEPPIAGVSLDGPELNALRDVACARGVHLLAGTVPEAIPGSEKVYNTSVLFGPDGGKLAVYRKIHLFDSNLSNGETHRESDSVAGGEQIVTADTPFGRLGLSVCYDLRFPELYRRMAIQGAVLFFVPAAFTLHTGRDHWTCLLRARAIENLSFVLAPAQWGRNAATRTTYGRSVIIDPWGVILAQAPDAESVVLAELDFEARTKMRNQLPCLEHIRPWLID